MRSKIFLFLFLLSRKIWLMIAKLIRENLWLFLYLYILYVSSFSSLAHHKRRVYRKVNLKRTVVALTQSKFEANGCRWRVQEKRRRVKNEARCSRSNLGKLELWRDCPDIDTDIAECFYDGTIREYNPKIVLSVSSSINKRNRRRIISRRAS